MKILFWMSFFWIFYAYIGYVAILTIVSSLRKRRIIKDDNFTPSVSFIIAAYNEEAAISRKIEETMGLDYPKGKIEIIIASDASTDRTDEIVLGFEPRGIKLVRMDERRGKTEAQNLAVSKAKGEILVFSDATTLLNKDAVKKLVRNFKNPEVGCVGGQEKFIKSDKEISKEAGFFWRYEKFIRGKESDFNTMIGVSGCIFAIRKKLYKTLDESLIEDFALPLEVAKAGFKVIYEPQAISYERAAANTKLELMRKTRIVSGGINVIVKMKELLNPFKYPFLSFQLISHKIFRWGAPVFMISLFVSNLFLVNSGMGFFVLAILQTIFYLSAILGHRLIRHFCIVNFAAIAGIFQFFKGSRKVIWEPIR